MHRTIEAVYNNGEFTLAEQPTVKRAKVLITFVGDMDTESTETFDKIKFPTRKLGKIFETERGDLYGDYLSDRF